MGSTRRARRRRRGRADYFGDTHRRCRCAAGTASPCPARCRRGRRCRKRFGKLPFEQLMAPAAEIAERGYAVPVVVQQKWTLASSGARSRLAARLRADLLAARPRAVRRRALCDAACGQGIEADRRDEGRGVLSRRDRGGARGACTRAWRRDDRGRPRGVPTRVGRTARTGLSRPHAARDPAERAGHRGADGAGHARALRSGVDGDRRRGLPALADRGDEARLRRRLSLRRRPAAHGRAGVEAARCAVPRLARQADRPASARSTSALATASRAARSTSPPPTRAA